MLQVEEVLASGGKYHYDAPSQSYYVVKGNQWISVEKPGVPPATSASSSPMGSIALKANFIRQQGLAGAMFWEVSTPRSTVHAQSTCSTFVFIVMTATIRGNSHYTYVLIGKSQV